MTVGPPILEPGMPGAGVLADAGVPAEAAALFWALPSAPGSLVLSLYLLLLFRFVVAAHKANPLFGKLVVIGLGFPIVFQAMTNMAVAVELLPVTGQTLPLISSGGSSIWMTCLALGIILSVTKKEEEIAEELAEKQKREDALQRMIDKQLQEEEAAEKAAEQAELGSYSIQEEANPLEPILKKK